MLFDSHCHLNDPALYGKVEEVLADAMAADVGGILCVGYDRDSSVLAMELSKKHGNVYAAIGFHPTNSKGLSDEDFQWLEENLKNPKVVAIGEIGLDYYWDDTFKDVQKEVFARQIRLANQYELPFSVHMRDATEDTLELIRKEKKSGIRGIMHCYSGSVESAKEFRKLGMMISLGGPVTFKNARVAKEVAKEIPLSSLLIETDSPYLAPHPFRGKENGPKYLHLIAREIAEIKEIPYEVVREVTTQNAHRIFQIQKASRNG